MAKGWRTTALRLVIASAVLSVVSACAGSTDDQGASGKETKVTALVGVGLKAVFTEAGAAFERSCPGARIELTFGHIPQLLAALREGTSADVVVTHDQDSLQRVLGARPAAGSPRIVARNRLVLVVAEGNPKGIMTPSDLGRPGILVLTCRPELPCGAPAQRILRAARVPVGNPLVDGGPSVVGIVARGEADAGIAFVTDVPGHEDEVDSIPVPAGQDDTIAIPAVVLGDRRSGEAAAFLDFLASPEGVAIFERHGFLPG